MSITPETLGADGPRRPGRRQRIVLVVLLGLVTAFVAVAVVRNWSSVRDDLALMSIADLVGAGAAVAAALVMSALAWMSVLDRMGGRMSARDGLTAYFAGQLGKYVPGSVWTVVIQAELGQRANVARVTMAASYVVALMVTVATGGMLGLLALTGPGDSSPWVLAVGAAVGAALTFYLLYDVRLLNRMTSWASARAGRSIPELHPSGATIGVASVLSAGSWAFFGLHIWLLARPLGADASLLVPAIGAFSLAFVGGLVALPLPAGAGIREAVLVVMLAGAIGRPGALTVSLVSRFVILAVELLLAGAFGVFGTASRLRAKPIGGTSPDR